MQIVCVHNFADWRNKARQLLLAEKKPEDINWLDADAQQAELFTHIDTPEITHNNAAFSVPKAFVQLAQQISCHRDIQRWHLLYSVLWRITHGERHLLKVSVNELMHPLRLMEKAISRDVHKMKAFVRFKICFDNNEDHYIAWHQPDHKILRLVSPFFQRRFNIMRWTIFTPDESVHWNGKELQFGPGVPHVNINDPTEDLWLTYYRSTFNPARIKLKAMRREMPVRFWHTLPETAIIPVMLAESTQRIADMLKQQS